VKVVPLIVLDRLSTVPSGWVSCADTISSERSDSSIPEFNSTVQVTVTEAVTLIGLDGELVTDTEAVEGTEGGREDLYYFLIHVVANLVRNEWGEKGMTCAKILDHTCSLRGHTYYFGKVHNKFTYHAH
jgi:hypothetical protein